MNDMNLLINELYRNKLIGGIDRALSDFCAKLAREDSPELRLAVALTSCRISSQNHASLNLRQCSGMTVGEFFASELLLGGEMPPDHLLQTRLPDFTACLEQIDRAGLDLLTVFRGERLYLRRYAVYEQRVADIILARAAVHEERDWSAALDRYRLEGEQRLAAATALNGNLSIITGGPGTGKTTTFARILGIMLEQGPLRIRLAAPTGKAAQRMTQSVNAACDRLQAHNPALTNIPREASTIHKLLGYIPHSSAFRHNRDNPLPVDLLVIDECSMIPLALLCKLLEAVPDEARIIMLGDKNQLEPVEVGAPFNDICSSGNPLLARRIAQLTKSYRFAADRGIGKLSAAVLSGVPEQVEALVAAPPPEVRFTEVDARNWTQKLQAAAVFFQRCRLMPDLAEAFAHFSQFRILTACRRRFLGCDNINDYMIEFNGGKAPFKGLPIMITANDYNEMLFNGDTGMIWQDDPDAPLFAAFPEADGTFRTINLNLLPPWEPAYAITVHKAQGSEAENILLMLPSDGARILCRELFFTGVTRAKNSVEIWYDDPAVLTGPALESQAQRGGLADRLDDAEATRS
jgi:exodeoxyribonuclease V alpha subunit